MQDQSDHRALTKIVGLVAGLVVMFALTIVLAVTAAFLVSDYGDDDVQTERPTVAFAFQYTPTPDGSDTLVIRHQDGKGVNPEQLSIALSGATCSNGSNPNGQYNAHDAFGLSSDNWMQAGMSLVIDSDNPEHLCNGGTLDLSDATVTVIWLSSGGEPVRLDTWTAP